MSDETIAQLADKLLDTIDAFSRRTRLTTGEVMTALFALMVQSAKASPNYDPDQLVRDVTDKIRDAVK